MEKQSQQDEYAFLIDLRKEISALIKNGAFEEELNLTEEEKQILDAFFDKTHKEVIEKILFKIRERLSYKNDNTLWKKNKFVVSTLAVTFPDCYHSSKYLHYLEEKYNEIFIDLGLDELGIVDCGIVLSQSSKKDSFYNISYSNTDEYRKNRYGINSYMLEVTYSMTKRKILKKGYYDSK